MPRSVVSWIALTATLLWPAIGTAQVVVGQSDTFQDGTTQSWTKGAISSIPPTNVATGGPAGAGDRYMNVTSIGGGGADSKLVFFNQQQWGGGKTYSLLITGLSMDLDNLGPTPLTIRVAFQDINFNQYSTAGFALPADHVWHHTVFSLTDANMTVLSGVQPFSTALATGIQTVRILHAASPAFSGDTIAAQLGVDNITAISPVPEPGMVLLTAAAAWFAPRAWRRVRGGRPLN